MTKRGRVLRDTNIGPGVITVEGKQYSFLLEGMWRSEVPPRPGMTVDVNFDAEGAPAEVYAVSENQVVKEQAQKEFHGTVRHGATIGEFARGPAETSQYVARRGRFSPFTLAVELILLVAFFVLPNLRLGAFVSRSLSGWEAVGPDPQTQMTTAHGVLSLLAILCLLAPIAAPFLKQAWARWLYAAPLSFVVLACIAIASQLRSSASAAGNMAQELGGTAAREMVNQLGPSYSLAPGSYIAIICAIYLSTRAFKSS